MGISEFENLCSVIMRSFFCIGKGGNAMSECFNEDGNTVVASEISGPQVVPTRANHTRPTPSVSRFTILQDCVRCNTMYQEGNYENAISSLLSVPGATGRSCLPWPKTRIAWPDWDLELHLSLTVPA